MSGIHETDWGKLEDNAMDGKYLWSRQSKDVLGSKKALSLIVTCSGGGQGEVGNSLWVWNDNMVIKW
ncbi:hypothetical protein E2C01_053191 [Portunus trituberculatus]|uniref:Uncharacterized protein n=1 Tax=Portunus trituberculatus TaxID=210409 RepID=A0A5B7GNU1_PORTR|nr:hypothetical protein [Portunus trituberculatus]